jgi:TP901 family phage tail tape measure protein
MAGRFSIEAVFKAIDKFSAPVAKMSGVADRMARKARSGIGATNRVVDKIAGGMKDSALAFGAASVVAGAAVLGVAKTGADFEQSIVNVGAVMGKSRSQIQDLEKEAMRLGVVTQFSSSEVADAMEMMARKGFDSKEILQGIPGVLNAVAASGEGMAEVSTVVGSAIRGFGLEAGAASHVADILAFSAEKTGARITEMGEALSIAAPTAKTLGVSIEDTAAAVGLLQKMGIDASTAGTATATMLAKITKPSKDAAEQMAHLGIKFKDAKGNMLPFRDVLGQFVKAGDKAGGNMNRMAFFAELVGLRGDKAAIALSDMSKSGDFDKLAQSLQKVDGYSEKVAKLRMDTTKGSWKLLTSTVEVLETRLFNLKSGAIKGVIDQTNAWIAANQDLIVQKVQDTIKDVADNLPKIEMWLKRIGIALAVFAAFAIATKVAMFATLAFEIGLGVASAAGTAFSAVLGVVRAVMTSATLATAASTVATWAQNTALAVGKIGTTGFTVATIASTVSTWAQNAALAVKNAALALAASVTSGLTLSTLSSTIATAANTVATWARNAALTAGTTVLGLYQIATGTATEATIAATGAMAPFLVTIGAVTAAVLALVAAWDQWSKLKDVSGGMGVTDFFKTAIKEGTLDPAKVVDAYQNDQARASSGETAQMVSPQERAASLGKGEITIKDQTGRASVTKAPKGGFAMPLVPASGTL